MNSLYPSAPVGPTAGELTLERTLPLRPIPFEEVNPCLLKSTRIGSAQFVGFDPETGLTQPRVVREYEVILFSYNGGYSVVNGQKYHICQGAVRFQKPGDVTYSYRYQDVHMFHFSLSPDPEAICTNQLLDNLPSFMMAINPLELQGEMEKLTVAQINGDVVAVKTQLWWLVQSLMRSAKAMGERGGAKQADRVETVKRYISEHFEQAIALEDLGRLVHLNPNYLHRVFKAAVGVTPGQYLNGIRLQNAYQLLLLTDYKLEHICACCGFNSQSYFIGQFKRRYGCTPNTVRRNELAAAAEHL